MSGLTQFHFVEKKKKNIVHVVIGLILLSPECTLSFLNEGDAKLCFLPQLSLLCPVQASILSASVQNICFFSRKQLGCNTRALTQIS